MQKRTFLKTTVVMLAGGLVCLLVAGAGRTAEAGRDGELTTRTLQHEGLERTFHVHLPPDFKKEAAAPLVLALHGGSGQGKLFDKHTSVNMRAAGDRRGMVLVFPEGMNRQWSDGRTEPLKENDDGTRGHDDVGFLTMVIDHMISEYGCDPRRVYVTGISNGGFMSVRMALDRSEKIAAVAPVAAQVSDAVKDRRPAKPVSLMLVNGTEDPLVPYDGGDVRIGKWGKSRGKVLSSEETVALFSKANGCAATPVRTENPDADPQDGTRVETLRYPGGRDGSEVVLVKVTGGGHTWPGGKQYLPQAVVGPVSRDVDATELILDFFLAHPKPAAAGAEKAADGK